MSMTIGNMVAIKQFTFGTDKTWADVLTITTSEDTVNAPGVKTTDFIVVTAPTHQAGLSYCATARCETNDVLTIKFINPTAGTITPTPNVKWNGIIFRADYVDASALI